MYERVFPFLLPTHCIFFLFLSHFNGSISSLVLLFPALGDSLRRKKGTLAGGGGGALLFLLFLSSLSLTCTLGRRRAGGVFFSSGKGGMCHAPAGGERERLLSHVKKINFRFLPADHSVHTIFFCLPRDGQFLFFFLLFFFFVASSGSLVRPISLSI